MHSRGLKSSKLKTCTTDLTTWLIHVRTCGVWRTSSFSRSALFRKRMFSDCTELYPHPSPAPSHSAREVNLPSHNSIIHGPKILEYKLNKQRLLGFGLSTFEDPLWFCVKKEVSPQSLFENVFLYTKLVGINLGKVSDASQKKEAYNELHLSINAENVQSK